MPTTRFAARANRAFLGRAVRYLAAEAGMTQFLDIGTGIPTAGNTHEVAQDAAPKSRIVYVDNDPIVMAHARALMTSHPAGATAFIQADLREPGRILADPELHATLDLGKPVALMLVAVLHFLTETENPRGIVAELVGALPSGSYLAISHLTADFDPDSAAVAQAAGQRSGVTYVPRGNAEVAAFFTGLDLVDPGVVPLLAWRPDDGTPEDPSPCAATPRWAASPSRFAPSPHASLTLAAASAARTAGPCHPWHQVFLIDALDGDRAEVGCALTQLPGLLVDR